MKRLGYGIMILMFLFLLTGCDALGDLFKGDQDPIYRSPFTRPLDDNTDETEHSYDDINALLTFLSGSGYSYETFNDERVLSQYESTISTNFSLEVTITIAYSSAEVTPTGGTYFWTIYVFETLDMAADVYDAYINQARENYSYYRFGNNILMTSYQPVKDLFE